MGTTAAYHRHVPAHPATDANGYDLVSGDVSSDISGGVSLTADE
jgi:hypothetical protein